MPRSVLFESSGTVVLDGNEMLVKGALEAGVALITGYPGSPVASVFDIIERHQGAFREKGIKGVIANNENQSAAILHGAMSVPGVRALTIFKSVGAYVALDGLAITNATIAEAGSAAVCVSGDDPALSSTQVGADSRFTFQTAHIPVLEPATNQEIKDWIGLAFDLAERCQVLVGSIITTNQADGGGTVVLKENRYPVVNMNSRVEVDPRSIALHQRVAVPPNSAWLEKDLVTRRLPAFMDAVRECALNRIEPGEDRRLGFVASGNAYNYVHHALHEMGLTAHFPLLKLGCTWPLDPHVVCDFARTVDSILVVEEKRGFLESQIKEQLRDAQQNEGLPLVPVWGKSLPEGRPGLPVEGGLSPTLLIERLGPYLLTLFP